MGGGGVLRTRALPEGTWGLGQQEPLGGGGKPSCLSPRSGGRREEHACGPHLLLAAMRLPAQARLLACPASKLGLAQALNAMSLPTRAYVTADPS